MFANAANPQIDLHLQVAAHREVNALLPGATSPKF
jgi:hypothetical protein